MIIIVALNNMISLQVVVNNKLSTIQTRDVAEQEFLYDSPPTTYCVKPEMLFDISPMWERPVSLATATWSTTDARFKILQAYDLMYDYFSATPSFRSFLKNYAFFRCHACAFVTVTGSINHQGTILVAATPSSEYLFDTTSPGQDFVNTLLTGPHSLLGANEASSTCIEIPFYVATDFLTLEASAPAESSIPDLYQTGRNPYAKLVLMCLNPLVAGGTGSTTLSIQVIIKINKLEVYVQTPSAPVYVSPPTLVAESFLGQVTTKTFDKASDFLKITSSDFIDALRSTVRHYTGLHNPNVSNLESPSFMSTRNRANVVDKPTFYEKMDPYADFTRITRDTIFHTKQDEMDMDYILSKPQYLGTFSVKTTDPTGTLLWVRPISPWQGGYHQGLALCSNIERLYYLTQAWSGDMELIIQSSMTNKQNVKLLVSKIYGQNRNILVSVPDYSTAKSGITNILEFSGGNQQQTITLDFLSRNQILYNTIDPNANALLHGMYYIYISQPLIVADDAPLSVEFNVYLRCKKGFRYYGYSMRPGHTQMIPVANLGRIEEESITDRKFEAESTNEPVMNVPTDSKPLLERDTANTQVMSVAERMYPVLNLRDLMRRLTHTGRFTAIIQTDGTFTLTIPVAALIGLYPAPNTQAVNQHLLKMFLGVNGGMRVKIRSFDSANHMIQYYPPTLVSTHSTTVTTFPLVTSVISQSESGYINIIKDSISGAPIMELPSMWVADIKTQESGSVMDIHIPHTTMYNWWGGTGWAVNAPVEFDGYQTIMNNMGYLIITGIGTPSTLIDFETFAGLDDEARAGFHVLSPALTIPIRRSSHPVLNLTYKLPEVIPDGTVGVPIKYAQSKSLYYSNLSTAYNALI